MTKTFILHIEEHNKFSIAVEAETAEESEEIASEDLSQFKPFKESGDWDITDIEEYL